MSAREGQVVLRDDLTWDDGEGCGMEFRLTYEGLLLASNMGRDEKTARKVTSAWCDGLSWPTQEALGNYAIS